MRSATHRAGYDTFLEYMGSTPIMADVRIVILLMPCCCVFFFNHCVLFCPFFYFPYVLLYVLDLPRLNTPLVSSDIFSCVLFHKLIDMIIFQNI